MPELPEVETVKNDLAPIVTGRTIKRIEFLKPRTLNGDPKEFARGVDGRRIEELTRRGKFLVFHLAGGKLMLTHLRMTGSFRAVKNALPEPPNHTRAIVYLDNGGVLYFIDQRRFGRFWLIPDEESRPLSELGPEPFSPEFTPRILGERLARHKAALKTILLKQEVLAGLGNLYVDEALFQSRLSPVRPANSLSSAELRLLHKAILDVLSRAIAARGASVATYRRPSGEKGGAQKAFQVARHAGEPCPASCGDKVTRIVVGTRGTYFCPRCQK
jgi:formamidopyrimidine-DNA glycosylase